MANEGRENNSNWDGIWEVSARITEVGWTAEMRIPFRTLKFDRADPQTWGVNFERKIRRLNEDSYWSPLPRIYSIERVSLAGSIEGMRGVRPGRNLRVKPYALGSTNTITGFDTIRDGEAGFDVKYGLTSGTTWDFTVNTDFSQVEADEQQVNLSRFSLFFPEKRDFFLENSGIYQFGGGGGGGGGGAAGGRQNASQDMRLFFSRRIGLSDAGEAIPILAGTRLTGRMGAYSMGALNIQQREEGRTPSTNFTALRMRRDILANSDIGVDAAEQGRKRLPLQPRRRRRCQLPLRIPERRRLCRQDVFACGVDSRHRRGVLCARPRRTTRRGRGSSAGSTTSSASASTTRWASCRASASTTR